MTTSGMTFAIDKKYLKSQFTTSTAHKDGLSNKRVIIDLTCCWIFPGKLRLKVPDEDLNE